MLTFPLNFIIVVIILFTIIQIKKGVSYHEIFNEIKRYCSCDGSDCYPGFVRQLMLKLKKAGLMTSVAGHARPSLSKPADQITLLDIYKAVEGEKPLLHLDTHTNPDCGVGINIQLSLQGFYNEIQKTAEEKMNTITLQDIINTYYQRTSMHNDLQNII